MCYQAVSKFPSLAGQTGIVDAANDLYIHTLHIAFEILN